MLVSAAGLTGIWKGDASPRESVKQWCRILREIIDSFANHNSSKVEKLLIHLQITDVLQELGFKVELPRPLFSAKMEEAEQDDSAVDHGAAAIPKRDVSVGRWKVEMGMVEITVKRGKLWASMGVIRNSKLYCHVEEAAYMVEQGSLVLLRGEDDIPISRQEVYEFLVVPAYGCSWDAYQIFCHLKRLGYIIGRYGSPWSTSRPKGRPTDLTEVVELEDKNITNSANSIPKSGEMSVEDRSNSPGSFRGTVLEEVETKLLRDALEFKDVGIDSVGHDMLEPKEKSLASAISTPNSCEISMDEQTNGQGNFTGSVLEGIQTKLSSPAVVCKDVDVDEDSLRHDGKENRFDEEKREGLLCLFSNLQLSEENPDICLNKEQQGDLNLMFDVHHPNGRFKKTAPGYPAFTLCIVKGQATPERRQVCELQATIGGRQRLKELNTMLGIQGHD